MNALPAILGMVGDLMFGVRVEDAVRASGYRMVWLQPGEDVVARMIALQPALFVVDIADAGVDWEHVIAQAKSSSATRRIPVLAFGAHVDTAATARARRAGADEVLARSRFVQALPELIAKHARVMRAEDWKALDAACAGPLPEAARRGLEEFNAGQYFECHETLEHLWLAETRPVRDVYRAVLQVAIAYHHVLKDNPTGALKMFARSKQWFNRLPARCQGVDLAGLLADAEVVEAALVAGETVGREALKPVRWEERNG
jgi:CheY-like chemotaxis protein